MASTSRCVDGSARFIKDTIDTIPYDQSGHPIGIRGNFDTYAEPWVGSAPRSGVFQGLTTRNGGEILDAGAW